MATIDKDYSAKKYIEFVNKLLIILEEMDKIDNNLNKKFRNNVRNTAIYNNLLEESNENLFVIVKNLK